MFDYPAYLAVRAVAALLNSLPLGLRLSLIYRLIRLFAVLNPKFNRVSRINLRIAYPQASEDEIRRLLDDSHRSFARLVVDSVRLHTLGADWIKDHVETPFDAEYERIRAATGGKGLLFAGGHLGSFELQGHAAPFQGRRFSFVVRHFKNKPLDRWWCGQRERFGNKVISRDGAVQNMIAHINAGVDVGILMDQNIRGHHAIFVDWFGKPAATTFALAKVALATRVPVIVAAITHLGDDRYRIEEARCDVESIYADSTLSDEQKMRAITERVSMQYQELIRRHPGEWFWMHRRWRTRPEGAKEQIYG